MLEQVEKNPYVPLKWVRKAKGMQGTELLDAHDQVFALDCYYAAMRHAIANAKAMDKIGVFKEIPNRLIEPFAWTKQIITGTQWNNFFALRTDSQAHHAMQKIARMMYLEYKKSVPKVLDYGEWHLPYVTNKDKEWLLLHEQQMVSVARCARVSYFDFDGSQDYSKDFDLYNRLLTSKHMSCFQHQATTYLWCDFNINPEFRSNFKGWIQYRKVIPGECIETFNPTEEEIASWELSS